MKILILGVPQHFPEKVYLVLDLAIGIRLPPFNDNGCSDHITCNRYVKLQILLGFRAYQGRWCSQILKASCASCVHWNLSCFLRSLKNGSPLTSSREMNLLKAAIHSVNFWTAWRLSGGFILVIANIFSGLGSIPCRETIFLSNFPMCTPNVQFSRFSLILNFLRLSKVSARLEMSPSCSRVLTTTSSTYASTLCPSCEYRHRCIPL
jgi:hypothetical protein